MSSGTDKHDEVLAFLDGLIRDAQNATPEQRAAQAEGLRRTLSALSHEVAPVQMEEGKHFYKDGPFRGPLVPRATQRSSIAATVADRPRGAYVPLTVQQIDNLRDLLLTLRTFQKPDAAGDATKLCDMAINSLLYAEEIQRLRDAPLSATLPTELTPMLLMNAAFCVEGNKVEASKRDSIVSKLLACASALRKMATTDGTTKP